MSEASDPIPILCRALIDGEEMVVVRRGSAAGVVFDVLDASIRTFADVHELIEGDGWLEFTRALARVDVDDSLGPYRCLPPVWPDTEVWAAGVTYEQSRKARADESDRDIYDLVYDSPRPELFFKASPARCVGDGDTVKVRPDATWQVPEPELAIVLNAALEPIGYTIGNDLTARDIEAANPLYLPQAKIWNGSCSLGPGIVPAEFMPPLETLAVSCEIVRGHSPIWAASVGVSRMRRSPDLLVKYLALMHDRKSPVCLLTGTGLVPPTNVSLTPGDTIRVGLEPIGTLSNAVASLDGLQGAIE